MIPRDIETTDQWQVRWTPPGSGEVVRTGNYIQMVFLWRQRREFGAIIEKRTITVGAWESFDPDAKEADDEAATRAEAMHELKRAEYGTP